MRTSTILEQNLKEILPTVAVAAVMLAFVGGAALALWEAKKVARRVEEDAAQEAADKIRRSAAS